MEMGVKSDVEAWMKENWGKRCDEYSKGCSLCKAWECFDYLFEFEGDE